MCLRYELDWSRANIPAFAAVSPNRETGPDHETSVVSTGMLGLKISLERQTLNESSCKALVVPAEAPIMVQSLGCSCE